jgi:hypothetical protein
MKAKESSDIPSKVFRIAKRTLRFIVENWLVIGFGLAAVLGYLFPRMSILCLGMHGLTLYP